MLACFLTKGKGLRVSLITDSVSLLLLFPYSANKSLREVGELLFAGCYIHSQGYQLLCEKLHAMNDSHFFFKVPAVKKGFSTCLLMSASLQTWLLLNSLVNTIRWEH